MMLLIILIKTMAQSKKQNLESFYNQNKDKLTYASKKNYKTVRKRITLSDFRTVIKTYFDIKFEELFTFGHETDIRVPLISGFFQIRKCMQHRSFHTLKDNVESAKQGKIVKYKIPITDDWYSVLIWSQRNIRFKKLKVIFSTIPNNKKKEFVKKKTYDNIITKVIPTI